LPFSSVIGIGLYASLRASDTGPIFLLEEEPRIFELHPFGQGFHRNAKKMSVAPQISRFFGSPLTF